MGGTYISGKNKIMKCMGLYTVGARGFILGFSGTLLFYDFV